MEKIVLQRANHYCKWFGFNLKPSYYVGVDGMTLVATSGWNCNNYLFIYRYDADADKWESGWENIESFHFFNKMNFKGKLNDIRKVKR